MEIKLDKQNFESKVLGNQALILVDFWAEWCGPCKAIAPVLEELGAEYEGKLVIGKLNVDEHPELAQRYGVTSIPNMKLFKNGEIVDEVIGVVPKEQLQSLVQKHL